MNAIDGLLPLLVLPLLVRFVFIREHVHKLRVRSDVFFVHFIVDDNVNKLHWKSNIRSNCIKSLGYENPQIRGKHLFWMQRNSWSELANLHARLRQCIQFKLKQMLA